MLPRAFRPLATLSLAGIVTGMVALSLSLIHI